MENKYPLLIAGILAACIILPVGMSAQNAAQPEAGFPEKLLEGSDNFDLAISMQADLRGNFGPCG